MFKTAHATKAVAHVLSLPRCDICACKGDISKSYMISYRDLYQWTTLANQERNSTTGDMTDSINEMQDRTASDIQWYLEEPVRVASPTRINLEEPVRVASTTRINLTLSKG